MEDSKIVDLYLDRDEAAISYTAEKYGLRLRQIAKNILNSMTAAEECENDTYLRAWNHIPPNEPRSYLFAFLGKIIRNLAIDECRKSKGRKNQPLFCDLTKEMEQCLPGQNNAEEAVEADMLSQAINIFLGTLPEEQRNIFVRRYWYFDTISEIAERYGFSQSKVKTNLFRMREELKKHLEKGGYTI